MTGAAHGPGEVVDVDEIRRVVERCPSVVRLSSGSAVEVASYLPGRRVPGIRVGADGLEIHVVARYGQALPPVADEIRRALAPTLGDRPVAVHIEDLDEPEAVDAAAPGPRPG